MPLAGQSQPIHPHRSASWTKELPETSRKSRDSVGTTITGGMGTQGAAPSRGLWLPLVCKMTYTGSQDLLPIWLEAVLPCLLQFLFRK